MRKANFVVATIEARMSSSRLPGKVMMKACGKPLLELLIERVRAVAGIDEVVVATTINPADDEIQRWAQGSRVACFRGSEDDVLKRVLESCDSVGGDIIVELTADNPLIDPELSAQTLALYLENTAAYVSNCDLPGFPNGMNVQVFSRDLLALADLEGNLPDDREHVSWFFRRQPDRFTKLFLPPPPTARRPELRLTVDELPDYMLVTAIFEALYANNKLFSLYDILAFLDTHPELAASNSTVKQRKVTNDA